jgi:hypothetical protein
VYRVNADGTFTLYSIGYNETDDGGEYTFGKRKTIQWEEGDWPWPSAAAE